MGVGQRREVFPNRGAPGEIQDISKNRVSLWTRRIRKSGFLPLPGENEDEDAKHQRVEHRGVEHGSKVRVQGRRAGVLISWPLRNATGDQCTRCLCTPTPKSLASAYSQLLYRD